MTALTRRGLLTRAGAAGLAIAVPGTLGRPAPVDPIPALIAEEERLRNLGVAAEDAADKLIFALPDELRRPRIPIKVRRDQARWFPASWHFKSEQVLADYIAANRIVGHRAAALFQAYREAVARREAAQEACGAGALRRQAAPLIDAANALDDRILRTRATTLGGVIAQIRFLFPVPGEGAAIVLAGLRDIQAREGLP